MSEAQTFGTQAVGREFPEGSTIAAPLTFVLESRANEFGVVDQYLVRAPWESEAKWVTVSDPNGFVINLPAELPGPADPPPVLPPVEEEEPTTPPGDGEDG